MRKLITLLLIITSLYSTAQTPSGSKVRYQGAWYLCKDTSASTSLDTASMLYQCRDSTFYGKAQGYWYPIVKMGPSGLFVRISDSTAMLSGYARYGQVVKYTDTANQTSGYVRKGFPVLYIDSANMLVPYLRKADSTLANRSTNNTTAINNNTNSIALKVNISDTAAMKATQTLDYILSKGNTSARSATVGGLTANTFGFPANALASFSGNQTFIYSGTSGLNIVNNTGASNLISITNAGNFSVLSGTTSLANIPSQSVPTQVLVSNSGLVSYSTPAQIIAAGGGGTGSVTSVSVTPQNGVSATVTNPTTTPALAFTLGNITPTSVVASSSMSTVTMTMMGSTTGMTSTWAQDVNVFDNLSTSVYKNIRVGNGSYGGRLFDNNTYWYANSLVSVGNYLQTGFASRLYQTNGELHFGSAPSGSQGNPITMTDRFTVDINGNITANFNAGSAGNFIVNNSGVPVTRTPTQVLNDISAASSTATFTLGSTSIALGSTTTTISGLASITATTHIGALTGNSSTATALATGRTIAITGDLAYTSPSFDGSTNVTAVGTLATVNSNIGSFGNSTAIPTITVNAKGLVTAVTTNPVIAPAGTLTGSILASNITASSLTSIGTLSGLTVTAAINGSVTGNSATVTTNANLTGPITSVGNATSIASQTGTGSTFVLQTSPNITNDLTITSSSTPNLIRVKTGTNAGTLTDYFLGTIHDIYTTNSISHRWYSSGSLGMTLADGGNLIAVGSVTAASASIGGDTYTKTFNPQATSFTTGATIDLTAQYWNNSNTGAQTVTLPTAAGHNRVYTIRYAAIVGAGNTLTVGTTSSQNIINKTTVATTYVMAAGDVIELHSDGSSWVITGKN